MSGRFGVSGAQMRITEELLVAEVRDRFAPLDATPALAYRQGAVLFEQGAVAREVFRLEHGLVKITMLAADGGVFIIELSSEPGSLIGASCAVLGRHYVSASVVTHNTQLRRVPAASFIQLIRQNPESSWSLHQRHCRLLADMVERSSQVGLWSVRQRVEQLIWKLASACKLVTTDKGLGMQLPLTYRELAQLASVSPEYLCRVLRLIENDGLIRRDKGWLYLLDLDRLSQGQKLSARLAE